ncbi:MAG: IS66 family transposase [Thermodesulfobacteriota bacterium]|nr:IS66 family transposase [Thermodesulfobacteriota bacterium]
MPSVNKQSLREEFDQLKKSFESLSSEGKVTPEVTSLFHAMILLFELLIAVFMEKKTKKNGRNSSIPSSQTDKDKTSKRSGTNGKGKEQNDILSENTRTAETTQVSEVHDCESCGEPLDDTPATEHERRTKIDIIFEKVVSHVDAEIKVCPRCNMQNKGHFPEDMAGPLQYGQGIKGYVVNLLVTQMISLKRAQKMIQTLIGQLLSEATLLKYVMQLHQALEEWEQASIECLLQNPAIHADETSLRVDSKNHWIHVYSAADITLKFLHPKRGLEAIEDIGVIPRYGGVIVHDCWQSYLSYDHCNHALCGSHLLRELTFIVDSNGYAWAFNIKRLLQESCAIVSKRKSKQRTEQEYKNLQKRYRNIMTRGEKELPPIPPKQNGKRGRVAKSDAHNLWERLKKHETAVLLFAKNSHVPFTNNRAERDLRMSKVKQKVSGCFRTKKYAVAYCRISSYLQTMANKGYNPLVAIQMVASGQIYTDRGE